MNASEAGTIEFKNTLSRENACSQEPVVSKSIHSSRVGREERNRLHHYYSVESPPSTRLEEKQPYGVLRMETRKRGGCKRDDRPKKNKIKGRSLQARIAFGMWS
ncbi:hypothetical protein CIRG_03645 [Coccidioides immitis RMSCC 2394]|uniref:Uncharacterized protein n=1 Tax=Coccidioides immitis RMSCC 2394 TaxID=404692 RepID=A0A0J6YAX6_COCIT|nr:hypothetical protein CIRG_03645 [Coccidioides immitis RMSCC 2394]